MMRQDRTEKAAVFHGLRQQAEKDNSKEPYMCLSDFIAPKVTELASVASLNGKVGLGQGGDQVQAIGHVACWPLHPSARPWLTGRPRAATSLHPTSRGAAVPKFHSKCAEACRSAAVRQ